MDSKKIKLGIVTGMWKRPEVFEMFSKGIVNLVNSCSENFDFHVVVAGSEGSYSRDAVNKGLIEKGVNTVYIEIANDPLAEKMNRTVQACKQLKVDYVLCLGSDDIITPELLNEYLIYMRKGIDFIGVLDCYFYDTLSKKSLYWGGYTEPWRKGHTCGAFRTISSRLLNAWNWQPWENRHSKGLDTSMQEKMKVTNFTSHSFSMKEKNIYALDIKSSTNMTPFQQWNNSTFIDSKILTEKFKYIF